MALQNHYCTLKASVVFCENIELNVTYWENSTMTEINVSLAVQYQNEVDDGLKYPKRTPSICHHQRLTVSKSIDAMLTNNLDYG